MAVTAIIIFNITTHYNLARLDLMYFGSLIAFLDKSFVRIKKSDKIIDSARDNIACEFENDISSDFLADLNLK